MYQVPPQNGRRFVVTGANSGTGKEATRRLAGAGAAVVLAVRAVEKGEQAKTDILRQFPSADLEVRRLDLADLSSVRAFAADLISSSRPVHGLLNNAGVMNPPTRETTADGFELQFGSNFLGPFLVTTLLVPKLLQSESPRVATMTSSAAWTGKIAWDDVQSERSYRPFAAYGQSKLADLVFATHLGALADRAGTRLISTSAHPGYTRTNLLHSGPNRGSDRTGKAWYYHLFPSMGIPEGTDSLLRAATDPTAGQGEFYGPRWFMTGNARPISLPRAARRTEGARLWDVAASLTGAPQPFAPR